MIKLAFGLAIGLAAAPAMATPFVNLPLDLPGYVLGSNLVVQNDGHVVATYIGSDAGYTSVLFLDGSDYGPIFNNHDYSPGVESPTVPATTAGATADLGFFTAGTVLKFFIQVNGATNLYSGQASNNDDGLNHALIADLGDGQTFVGFEDIAGYPENSADFNDLEYSFTNVGTTAVPLPAAGFLLLAGMAGLTALRRKRG